MDLVSILPRLVLFLCVIVICGANGQADSATPPPESASSVRALGDAALKLSKFGDALKHYTHLIALEPNRQISYFKRGSAYLMKKDFNKAVSDFSRAIEKDPGYKTGYLYRGKAYKNNGQCTLAAADFRKVLELRATDKHALQLLPAAEKCEQFKRQGLEAIGQGRLDDALQLLSQALQEAPYDGQMLMAKSQVLFERGDYQSVLMSTGSILKAHSNNLDALHLRGQAYFWMSEFEMALTHYKRGLRSDPDHKALKKSHKALKKLTRAIKNAEDEFANRKWRAAAEDFELALGQIDESHPKRFDLFRSLCDSFLSAKKSQQAIDACEKALQINPEDAQALALRADAKMLVAKTVEDFEGVVRDFEAASERDPQNRRIKESLNKARFELKKAKRKDYYKMLGISKHASQREIKKAFRKAAVKVHPDKAKNDEQRKQFEEQFREINEANDVLGDDDLRRRYDAGEDVTGNPSDNNNQQRGGGGFNPFGGGGGFKFHF